MVCLAVVASCDSIAFELFRDLTCPPPGIIRTMMNSTSTRSLSRKESVWAGWRATPARRTSPQRRPTKRRGTLLMWTHPGTKVHRHLHSNNSRRTSRGPLAARWRTRWRARRTRSAAPSAAAASSASRTCTSSTSCSGGASRPRSRPTGRSCWVGTTTAWTSTSSRPTHSTRASPTCASSARRSRRYSMRPTRPGSPGARATSGPNRTRRTAGAVWWVAVASILGGWAVGWGGPLMDGRSVPIIAPWGWGMVEAWAWCRWPCRCLVVWLWVACCSKMSNTW